MKKIALKNAARGTAFDYAGQSWILLENDDGRALCLSKDIIETRAFDEGNCNNFAVASSKEYLNGAYLDNLLEDVNGPNAFLTTELDLTTDDGLKDYGTCTVTIFLLTVDQYGATATSSPMQTTGGGCPPPSARSLTATSHSPATSTPMALCTGASPASAATACAPLVIWTPIS